MKLKLPNFGSLCKENILVNGDFNCWQRGETFTIKGDEAFHYTADMWCVYAGTGQTITVKKTTDGLQFSGTSAIMQRMSPLKVGQKYVFLCKVDGDVKTLSITGGTYTENSFLKYNKSGSYEQFQIKSNGTTNIANARLWEGDTVYKLVKEDKSIALMRCQQYLLVTDGVMGNGNVYRNAVYATIPLPVTMLSKPTVLVSGVKAIIDGISEIPVTYCDMIIISNNCIMAKVITSSEFTESLDGKCTRLHGGKMVISCEPL